MSDMGMVSNWPISSFHPRVKFPPGTQFREHNGDVLAWHEESQFHIPVCRSVKQQVYASNNLGCAIFDKIHPGERMLMIRKKVWHNNVEPPEDEALWKEYRKLCPALELEKV